MGIFLLCLGVISLLVVGAAAFLFMTYNRLVSLKNILEEGWSGIDVQLKRRYDLIPNLVETVKGYAKHESDTLAKVIELRNSAMSAEGVDEKARAEASLSHSIKSIFALAEAYPELRANENFMKLHDDLSKIEDDLQNARRYYNGTVREFNTSVQLFPTSIIAGMLGFKSREFFGATEEERQNVKVDFTGEQGK